MLTNNNYYKYLHKNTLIFINFVQKRRIKFQLWLKIKLYKNPNGLYINLQEECVSYWSVIINDTEPMKEYEFILPDYDRRVIFIFILQIDLSIDNNTFPIEDTIKYQTNRSLTGSGYHIDFQYQFEKHKEIVYIIYIDKSNSNKYILPSKKDYRRYRKIFSYFLL